MNVTFTKFAAKSDRLVKSASLIDNKINTEGATNFFAGTFKTEKCKWKDFGNYLENIQNNECIALGVCVLKDKDGKSVTYGNIKVKSEVTPGDTSTIARVKGNFEWEDYNRLVYLDIDHISSTSMSPSEVFSETLSKLPELKNIKSGFWLKPSSGAYLVSDQTSSGLSGLHCYFLLPEIYDIADFKNYIEKVSWEGNHVRTNFSRGLNAKILNCHVCDISVFSPMRLIYEGNPICGEGINVDFESKKATFISTSGDNILDLFSFDNDVALHNKRKTHLKLRKLQVEIQKKRQEEDRVSSGRSRKAQKRIQENLETGLFPSSLTIHTDNHGEVKAWKFLIDPEFWHQKTCRDPHEPDYDGGSKGKAKIFTDGEGCRIHSFAHGDHVDRVVWDLQSINEVFEEYGKRGLEDMGIYWEEIVASASISKGVNEIEVGKLQEIVKEKFGLTKEEVSKQVASAGSCAGNIKVKEALKDFNTRWCRCPISNKVRYFCKQFDPAYRVEYYKPFDKEGMKNLESNNIVKIFNGKKMVNVVVADQWLKWRGLKSYKGCYFDPHHDPSKGELGNGCLNLYEGHAVPRATVRGKGNLGWSCNKERCNGVGCFKWSVDNGFGVCPEKVGKGGGNWTYYVHHIYEVICGGSGKDEEERKEHAIWVLDWLVEVIQRPTSGHSWCRGVTKKPCTSLVVRGGSGDGKGSLFAPLQQILGKYARQMKSMRQLTGRFNAFSIDNILLFADEATWGGGHEAAGVLKGMVTEEMSEAERKGVDSEGTISHTRLCVSSNTAWVIPTELDDRRFSVFDVTDARHNDFNYFNKVSKNKISQFLDLCLDWTITSDLHRSIQNEALEGQKIQNDISEEEEFLLDFYVRLQGSGKIPKKIPEKITVVEIKKSLETYFGLSEWEIMPVYRRLNKVLRAFGVKNPGKDKDAKRNTATNFRILEKSSRWKRFLSLHSERDGGAS